MKDYYKILELTPKCSFQDVINHYNQYISMFNQLPQLSNIQKEQLKEIKEGFFVLGDYHRRRQYDNKRDGYVKQICESTNDRCFFRPEVDYKFNLNLKDTQSDIQNNKKVREPIASNTEYYTTNSMAKII